MASTSACNTDLHRLRHVPMAGGAFAYLALLAGVATTVPTDAHAQSMPGMDMGHKADPAIRKPSGAAPTAPAPADEKSVPETSMPTVASQASDSPAAASAAGNDTMAGMAMDHSGHHHHILRSGFGPYPGNRDASGTSWQPDVSPHVGLHGSARGWDLMLHGSVEFIYGDQSGPRGDDKTFLLGHVMGAAARDLSPRDRLQVRVALTPDPVIGPRGYPLLFATGETADGRTQLIDRQHPHDLVSELSVALSHRFTGGLSGYVFYGEVGDPAFGPPAYIHRLSIEDDPEAPISHHWLDSVHGSQGVVTAGLVAGRVKLEASRFRGREPDQNRYDIEAPGFDSTAARVSWNPTATLALQASYAYQESPEQVTSDQNQRRYSASAIYTRKLGEDGFWSTTFAWGRRIDLEPGEASRSLDAFVLESAVHPDTRWTVFGRAERVDNDELLPAAGAFHGAPFTVGKVSLGGIRDVRLIDHVLIGFGAVGSRNFVPRGLDAAYGGDRWSGEAFVRFKID